MRYLLFFLSCVAAFGQATPLQLRVFTNYVDMVTRANPSNVNKAVLLLGGGTTNDGLGGFFLATTNFSTTNSNDVIRDRNYTNWAWNRISIIPSQSQSPFVNIVDYGADPSGVTNSAAFINLAITNAAGRKVIAPKGTYKLEHPVVLVSNTRLEGLGAVFQRDFAETGGSSADATIKTAGATDPASGDTFVALTTNITVSGIIISAKDSTDYGKHLGISRAQYVTLNDIEIRTAYGVVGDWATFFYARNVNGSNIRIKTGPNLNQDGLHIAGGSDYNFSNLDIESGDDAIALAPVWDVGITNVNISGATVYSHKGYAVKINTGVNDATNGIRGVTISGVKGTTGVLRNGGILIYEYMANTANPPRANKDILLRDITLKPGVLGTHDGANPYGAFIFGGENITLENVGFTGPTIYPSFEAQVSKNITFRNCYSPGTQTNLYSTIIVQRSLGSATVDGGRFTNNLTTTFAITNNNENLRVVDTAIECSASGVPAIALNTTVTNGHRVYFGGNSIKAVTTGIETTGAALSSFVLEGNVFDSATTTKVLLSGTSPTYRVYLGNRWLDDYFSGAVTMQTNVSIIGQLNLYNPAYTAVYGSDSAGGNARTDNTDKIARLGVAHYDNEASPIGIMNGFVNSTGATISLGGGSSLVNAATAVDVYAAANNTTATGTKITGTTTSGFTVHSGGLVVGATNVIGSLAGKSDTGHGHAATDIVSGTMNTARLGSGTADSTTYLRGDSTWQTVSAGGEANTASNLGTGYGVWYDKNSVDLRFNSISNGIGVTVSSNANLLTIRHNIEAGANITLSTNSSALVITSTGGAGSGDDVYVNGANVTHPDFDDSSTAIWSVNNTNVTVYPTNLANAQIASAAAIDATKIADGSVSSTEFQYISTVTSDVQTQINGKQASFTTGVGVTNVANVLSANFYPSNNITFSTNEYGKILISSTGGGGGDSVTVDGAATVDPNFDDGGDINFTYSSPNITADVKANSVALGTDTTGNYVSDVAGTANEVSVSHTPAEGSTATISLPATIDLGGKTSFELPNAAAPTTDAVGEIALDTTITDHQGLLQYYTGTNEMLVVAIKRTGLTATDNHIISYDAATDTFLMEAASGGSTYNIVTPLPVQSAKLPSSDPAQIDASSTSFKLLYDDTTTNSATWFHMSPDWNGTTQPVAKIFFKMTSATSGAVTWGVSMLKGDTTDDFTVETGYDTENTGNASVLSDVDYVQSLSITLNNDDGVGSYMPTRIRLRRLPGDASDTASGDAEVVGFTIIYER